VFLGMDQSEVDAREIAIVEASQFWQQEEEDF
jgi:hypothetical protein